MKHRIYRLAPKDFVSGLALLFVVLLLPLSAAAQVTVKDSVVVASPPDTTGEEGSTAVRVLPSSSLAKVAANVSLPEGGQIVVTIIGGAGAAVHDLVLRSPISVTIVQNANANHGFTWVSPVFPAGTTVDLGLIWYWWGMTGSEWGSQTTRLNDSTYQIGFEDIGFSPLYVDVIVRVVVRRVQNNPPVITSVVFDPARRYFAYGSEVSVRAEAVDPDGDAVTISYAPGSTFTLNTFGAVVVTVTATDSKGASTTRTETIYSVAVGITPPVDRVIDGGAASYRVYIAPQEIAASSFEWMWEPKDPAGGNNPHVDFQPSPMAQEVTVTPAKWYASPDDECGAKAEATYLLNAKVFFNGDEFETEMAQMTVFLDRRGGVTSAPDIAGFPGIVAIRDNRGDVVKVKVDNIGTLRRIDPKAKIFPSQSSQFYEKIKAHEEAHVEQLKTGIARDLWSVDALFKRLRNLDAVSEMLLEQKVNAEIGKFKKEQIDSFNKLWDKMQVEAYSISDPMPPRYFYQRCGRTTFPKL